MEQQAVDVSGRTVLAEAAVASTRMRAAHLSLVRSERPRRALERPTALEVFRTLDLAIGFAAALLIFDAFRAGGAATGGSFADLTFGLRDVVLLAAGAAAWPGVFGLFGLYDAGRARTVHDEAVGLLAGSGLALLALLLGLSWLGPLATRPRYELLFVAWPGFAFVAISCRWLCRRLRRSRDVRRVLIVGSGARAYRLARRLEGARPGTCRVIGYVDDPHEAIHEEVRSYVLGELSELAAIVLRSEADEVYVALPFRSLHAESGRAIALCVRMGVPCRQLMDLPDMVRPRAHALDAAFATMRLEREEPEQWSVSKRAADVVGAAVGLLALSPVFLAIALAIRLTSRGPVFFRQERYGLHRRPFRMFKFRTMRRDAETLQAALEALNEATGPVFKIRDDPRVTPVGRFLRRWSLDELPQLFNVLLGHMTLVGPRPMSVRDAHRLNEPDALRRFTVPPGMTGLWQVTSRDSLDFDDWVEHDLDYIDRWTPGLELRILARTLPTVLRGVGSV